MAARPIFTSNLKNAVAQIQNADTSSLITLLTPGTSGSRLKSLNVSSDDTSARVIQLWLTVGAVDYLLGEISVPAGAGSDGSTLPIKILDTALLPFLQFDGVNYIMELANGAVLKVKSKTTVTAAKKIQFFGEYGDI